MKMEGNIIDKLFKKKDIETGELRFSKLKIILIVLCIITLAITINNAYHELFIMTDVKLADDNEPYNLNVGQKNELYIRGHGHLSNMGTSKNGGIVNEYFNVSLKNGDWYVLGLSHSNKGSFDLTHEISEKNGFYYFYYTPYNSNNNYIVTINEASDPAYMSSDFLESLIHDYVRVSY
jgi:hypothetical protein